MQTSDAKSKPVSIQSSDFLLAVNNKLASMSLTRAVFQDGVDQTTASINTHLNNNLVGRKALTKMENFFLLSIAPLTSATSVLPPSIVDLYAGKHDFFGTMNCDGQTYQISLNRIPFGGDNDIRYSVKMRDFSGKTIQSPALIFRLKLRVFGEPQLWIKWYDTGVKSFHLAENFITSTNAVSYKMRINGVHKVLITTEALGSQTNAPLKITAKDIGSNEPTLLWQMTLQPDLGYESPSAITRIWEGLSASINEILPWK